MHPSRLRLGPSQSRPLTDASPGSARSPGLRVCRAAPSRRRNIHTHAPFRTECQSFLRCRDMRLTISRKQRSGHAAALAGYAGFTFRDLPLVAGRGIHEVGGRATPRRNRAPATLDVPLRCMPSTAIAETRNSRLHNEAGSSNAIGTRAAGSRAARREVDRFRSVAVTSGSAQGRGRSGPPRNGASRGARQVKPPSAAAVEPPGARAAAKRTRGAKSA